MSSRHKKRNIKRLKKTILFVCLGILCLFYLYDPPNIFKKVDREDYIKTGSVLKSRINEALLRIGVKDKHIIKSYNQERVSKEARWIESTQELRLIDNQVADLRLTFNNIVNRLEIKILRDEIDFQKRRWIWEAGIIPNRQDEQKIVLLKYIFNLTTADSHTKTKSTDKIRKKNIFITLKFNFPLPYRERGSEVFRYG